MPHGYSDRNAKRLRRYTGLTHAQAKQLLKDRAGKVPRIPAATGPQRLLEALIFEHLRGDVDYFAHPIGIRSVFPQHDSLVVSLDASSTRRGYPLVAHALDGLLPAELPKSEQSEDDVRVIGVPGIRITRASRKGLRVSLAGTKASVFLTCDASTNWADLLADHRAQLEAARYRPCWSEPKMTPAERAFHQDHAEMARAVEEASWLPSGLLRRSALLHEVSAAYCTRYWVTWDQWRIELKHDPGVKPPHNAFINHLTDPKWGMNLAVDKLHCQCDVQWADPHYDRQCTVELSSPTSRPGVLQVRFRAMGTWCNAYDTYRDLKRAGANPAWLRRVMPQHHHRRRIVS
ncbi:hypothetical protein QQM39_19565 [Streptomyces sp. DT2A-34]|uniref:hypothetical protein n=1 Tax=Streptomyces sp. DT2A-34 TaxID=3051182 RepID=UPI00265C5E7C|nr:hypothetical protein [Streptomyces sp. DT2A-34]MDO0912966.1 hypothetical protein [Streptomyces sp. DT2A-34]